MMTNRRTAKALRARDQAITTLTALFETALIERDVEGCDWFRPDAQGQTLAHKVAAILPHFDAERAAKIRDRFTEVCGLGFRRALDDLEALGARRAA